MLDNVGVEAPLLGGTRGSGRKGQRQSARHGGSAPAAKQGRPRWLPVLCAALAFAGSAPALAREPTHAGPGLSQPKVVVLRGFTAVERAISQALAPWKMRVEVISARHPGSSMPVSAERAQVLAEQLKADALVWISTSPDGTALWVHDARTNNVTSRATPRPPFDPPTAAALALSVKTFLRASGLTPEEDAAVAPARPAPPPALAAQPKEISEPPAPRPTTAPPSLQLVRGAEPAAFQVLVHGAVRLGAFQPPEGGARYGMQVRWSPWAHGGPAWQSLWLGLEMETSTPWLFSRAEFDGQLWEAAPAVCAGVLHPVGSSFRIGVHVRSALHVLSLSGTFLGDTRQVRATSISPSLLVRPELGLVVGNLTFLLQPGAGTFLKRHVYEDLQASRDVLETRHIWWTLGGAISLRAD